MAYKVAIRKNDTGEVRIFNQDLDWDNSSEFWWTEGNMACDCNRELKFARAANEDDNLDGPCGDTRFAALYAELPDGTKIELDDPTEIPDANT